MTKNSEYTYDCITTLPECLADVTALVHIANVSVIVGWVGNDDHQLAGMTLM
jgi:hypothetical protein